MSKITPCLWFNGDAEEAANFYVSLFPDSSIGGVSRYGENMPMPAGTAMLVEFTLAGQSFQGLNGGPQFPHSEAISMSIRLGAVNWTITAIRLIANSGAAQRFASSSAIAPSVPVLTASA